MNVGTRTLVSGTSILCFMIPIGCDTGSIDTDATSIQPAATEPDSNPSSQSSNDGSPASFYTVAHYDESRDPVADLVKTLTRARLENKRVILQVGGDWCEWCSRITNYMSTNPAVRSEIEQNFLVMKVAYPGEQSAAFLASYPKCEAYPHLFVIEKNGDFLHSQETGEMEAGDGYDEEVFLKFLTTWAP